MAGAPPSSSQRSRAFATLSRDVGGVRSPLLVSPSTRSPDRLGVFVISGVAKWSSDFPRTCLRRVGLPVRAERDLQHFAAELFSKRGPRRRKSACRCLFARKTNTAKTGYSQTHGPKIISVRKENVASRQVIRRESAHDAK